MWPALILAAVFGISQHHYLDTRAADYRYFQNGPRGCESWEDRHKPICEEYASHRPGLERR